MSAIGTLLRECWDLGEAKEGRILTRFVSKLEYLSFTRDSIPLSEITERLRDSIEEVKEKEVQLEPA